MTNGREDDVDMESEVDLDLYDTDEIPDSASFSGLPPPSMQRDSAQAPRPAPQYARAVQRVSHDDQRSDTASNPHTHPGSSRSLGGSSQRQLRRPADPNPTIRTDFTTTTTAGTRDDPSHTPYLDDHYDMLATPPGEPGLSRPEEGVHPAYAAPPRTEISMRAEWLIGFIVIGIGIGIAVSSQTPNPQVSYWLTTIGDLYVRMTACITLPMAFCQVLTSTAELVNVAKLRRVWMYTMLYFLIMVVLSAWVGIFFAGAFQKTFKWQSPRAYRIPRAKFAFKCGDGKFIEQSANGLVKCTGTGVNFNTTFPRLVDLSQRLGVEEAVGNVNISGYVFALLDVYVPVNVFASLARDNFLSSLIIALVLGVAIGKSYTCPEGGIKHSRNPLFRLFTHIYLSLFTMNDWIQRLALWATIPLLMGSVLEMPNASDTLRVGRYYLVAVLLACFAQSLVIVPAMFFFVTRKNPYRWIARMLAPMSYGMILSSAFYPLPMATKAALRSNDVSPIVFGAVYPLLSVLNRSHFALGVPCGMLYTAAFSGCSIELTASNLMLMFFITCIGSLGDTMLPRAGMAYFLMQWRAFCKNEDTPSALLMIATIGILIFRLSAFVGIMTNMQLIRMISHVMEKEDNKTSPTYVESILEERRPQTGSTVPPAPLSTRSTAAL